MLQLGYGTILPSNGMSEHTPLIPAVICHENEVENKYERRKLRSFSTYGFYFFYVHFCSYLLTSEGKGEKQRKETNIYCLWLHQALFMRSQSVTLTVDIHLSLIAWLQIGGHLYKTVKSETKTTYSHVLYTLPELIDSSVYCISLCFIIWWNCAHVWCLLPQRPTSGCQYTLMYLVLYGHARNNHWQDNQRCVMFGLYLTLATLSSPLNTRGSMILLLSTITHCIIMYLAP